MEETPAQATTGRSRCAEGGVLMWTWKPGPALPLGLPALLPSWVLSLAEPHAPSVPAVGPVLPGLSAHCRLGRGAPGVSLSDPRVKRRGRAPEPPLLSVLGGPPPPPLPDASSQPSVRAEVSSSTSQDSSGHLEAKASASSLRPAGAHANPLPLQRRPWRSAASGPR